MRKTRAKKRILTPDPKFNDVMVTRFVNGMMYDGKKSVSLNIFYTALDIVEKKITEEPGIETWRKAMNNVMPS
ncbi:MAG: 30S ribosomal protein S7, partial [Flavobacteriia bacterium]|nr:30S ribosomal protein S7 [Flavobacteriia bacterium]